ncbi:MAG TPA: hypothetical protein VLA52_11200 [Thermohalobaculum sp.]|nr:hypothetical protein [Thermohalobaculum sp.]
MSEAPKTASLPAFLSRLSDEDAAQARVAAARIDALEREIGPPGWIERNMPALIVIGLALFAVGVGVFIAGIWGWFGLGGAVLLIAPFPVLFFVYLLSVRRQTRLDSAKMALNDKYFLPHGGVYFGGGGKVLLCTPPTPAEPNLRERVNAQYEAATRKRWWT